jgi:hypothetical protein
MGHVGRSKYLPMTLPIKAQDMDEAIKRAKNHGGVKRDHKDWCLESPIETTFEEYEVEQSKTYSDEYWNNKTRTRLQLFEERLEDEPNYHQWKDIKSNRNEFIKLRDESVKIFKLKKMKAIMESLGHQYGRNIYKNLSA